MSENDDAAIRGLAKKVAKTSKETRDQARASQASFRAVQLTDGPVSYFDESGIERLQVGAVGQDGEFTIQEMNAPAPPTPTAPDTFPFTAAIAVSWDGTFETANRPADLNRVEIHASQDGPTFDCTDETQVGTFIATNGGEFTFSATNASGVWYFRLVAVNNSEIESDPSAADSSQALTIIQSTDGLFPPQVQNVIVDGIIKSMFLSWDAVVNADPVEYLVYGGADSGFALDSNHYIGKVGAPRASVSKVYDPTSGILVDVTPGTLYYFVIVAKDNDGPGTPSVEVSGTPVQINSPDIATDAIIARTIKAGSVTATKLEAILALVTTLIIGDITNQAISLDATNGFIVKDSAGNILFKIPLIAGQPIFARSNIVAESITALGQVSLRDTGDVNFPHELAQSAKFRLNSGVTAPSTAPAWAYNYPQRSTSDIPFPAGYSDGLIPTGGVLDDAGTSLVMAATAYGPTGNYYQFFYSTHLTTGVTTALKMDGPDRVVLAMTKVSTSVVAGVRKWAVLWFQPSTSAFNVGYFDFAWTFVPGSVWTYPWSSEISSSPFDGQFGLPDMTYDGTNLVFFQIRNSDGHLFMHKRSVTGGVVSSTDTGVVRSRFDHVCTAVYHATFDYGSPRFVVTVDGGQLYVFTAAGARSANDEWPLYAGGSAYDGPVFWNPNSSTGRFEHYIPNYGQRIYTYGKHIWTSATFNTQRISHAWADTTPNKTIQGARAILASAVKRAYYRVTLPVPPSPATRAYYYWGTGADTSAVTNMWEQGFLSGGATTFDVEVPTFSGTNPVTVTGAIAGASASDFFSQASDANGPLARIQGDGTWRLATLTGMVLPFAGSAAPHGFLLCDGTSVTTAAYPALFAVVGYTYGGSGANFNLPDMRDRTIMGVSGTKTLGVAAGADSATVATHVHNMDHTHPLSVSLNGAPNTGTVQRVNAANTGASSVSNTDAGGGHTVPTIPKHLALNYLIKT